MYLWRKEEQKECWATFVHLEDGVGKGVVAIMGYNSIVRRH